MAKTLEGVRDDTLYDLGDAGAAIWSNTEIEDALKEGYDRLVYQTRCFWDQECLPDWDFAFSHTAPWEVDYLSAGDAQNECGGFVALWERDWVDNAGGPANHTAHWEHIYSYTPETRINPLAEVPEELLQIDRSTWNTKRLEAFSSGEIEFEESRYELNTGEVEAYLMDKDGLRTLRKWRVPAAAYSPYTFDWDGDAESFTYTRSWEAEYVTTGEARGPLQFTAGSNADYADSTDQGPGTHNHSWEAWFGYVDGFRRTNDDGFGIIRNLGDIDSGSVDGNWGDLIQIPDEDTFSGPWGIVGPVYKEANNVRIQLDRRGKTLSPFQDFELPDRYVQYVQWYAMARALEREGSGQDLDLAAHYDSRFSVGVERIRRRQTAINAQRKGGYQEPFRLRSGPPRPALPWQYPR